VQGHVAKASVREDILEVAGVVPAEVTGADVARAEEASPSRNADQQPAAGPDTFAPPAQGRSACLDVLEDLEGADQVERSKLQLLLSKPSHAGPEQRVATPNDSGSGSIPR
jgi:hypothetical protein